MTKEYEEIRKLFNESSIDYFIEKVNENLLFKSSYERNGMNTIQRIQYSFIINENNLFNELIRLKNKTKVIKSINYYLSNKKELAPNRGYIYQNS